MAKSAEELLIYLLDEMLGKARMNQRVKEK